jgi:predicted phosphodiesterase
MLTPTANLLLASDLHLDMGHYDLSAQIKALLNQGERIDAVLLLGDIMEVAAGSPVAYAKMQVPTDIPVAFVPGNHDFYGGRYGNLLNIWRAQALHSHVRVLVEEEMIVPSAEGGEIVLLGTPLWSNLEGLGPLVETDLRRSVHKQIADFSCIFDSDGSAWTALKMIEKFERAYLFLKKGLSSAALADGRRRVVATHFGPHRQSITPRWKSDDVSAYFCNHLPELVERADVWLHGHTHDGFEYQIGEDPDRGLVICHPRGYPRGSESEQALRYVPRLIKVPIQRTAWPEPVNLPGWDHP